MDKPPSSSRHDGTEPTTAPEVQESQAAAVTPASDPSWTIGATVTLQRIPRYLKTADPMPMLRPPDLVGIEEVGVVVAQRALGQLAVRFRRGTFLIDAGELRAAEPAA